MSWLALSLLSAFLLASGDAAAKRFLQGYAAREMTIVYGALLFRESDLRQHLAAGALMVAGVALLLLS